MPDKVIIITIRAAFKKTIESNNAIANATLGERLENLARASFSTNEKQNQNQSLLVRAIFRVSSMKLLGILIGSSRSRICSGWDWSESSIWY